MFQKTLRKTTWQMGQNTVAIWTTAPLQYLLLIVKVVALERSPLVMHEILRLFVNTLTADDKPYRLNRDNLTQSIQMQLSQKQKTFSQFFFFLFFFFAFSESILNLKRFPNKYDLHSWCICGITGSGKHD